VRMWAGSIWLGMGFSEGPCEHVNETLGSKKGEEILDQLNYCQLRQEDSALWSLAIRYLTIASPACSCLMSPNVFMACSPCIIQTVPKVTQPKVECHVYYTY
jgi:hypothetical protein